MSLNLEKLENDIKFTLAQLRQRIIKMQINTKEVPRTNRPYTCEILLALVAFSKNSLFFFLVVVALYIFLWVQRVTTMTMMQKMGSEDGNEDGDGRHEQAHNLTRIVSRFC